MRHLFTLSEKEKLYEIFTPIQINKMWIKNRIVMAPFLTNDALEDGSIGQRQIDYYLERAKGGIGLIIVEGAHVTASRKFSPKSLGIDSDYLIPRYKEFVKQLKSFGAKVAIQIGENLHSRELKPSDLSVEKIYKIISNFVDATARVREAGFDAVEFHLGHSYTLVFSQSLMSTKFIKERGAIILAVEGRERTETILQIVLSEGGIAWPNESLRRMF